MTRRTILLLLGAGALALWAGNTSVFHDRAPDQIPSLIAHRGVHQIYVGPDRTAQTCRAHPIAKITHGFVENTLASMRAAFAHGAAAVEIDVHLTRDGQFAVFHDWTLGCLTDGTGVTRNQTMDDLRGLDLGHGWSADGTTYPLRGTAEPMPTLAEVLAADLPGPVLINIKSNDPKEGAALSARIAGKGRSAILGVYGGAAPVRATRDALPDLPGYDKPGLKACLIRYALLGWSGRVPKACRTGLIAVPINLAPYLWGWPHRLTARMQHHETKIILLGPYDGSGFSSGIDDLDTLARVPAGFDGYLWTNRIEVIGPALGARP